MLARHHFCTYSLHTATVQESPGQRSSKFEAHSALALWSAPRARRDRPRKLEVVFPSNYLEDHVQNSPKSRSVIVSRFLASLAAGEANLPCLSCVPSIILNLSQKLIIITEEVCFDSFTKEGRVLRSPLSEHEATARWDFDTSGCLKISIHLSKEAKINVKAADSFCIFDPPKRSCFYP